MGLSFCIQGFCFEVLHYDFGVYLQYTVCHRAGSMLWMLWPLQDEPYVVLLPILGELQFSCAAFAHSATPRKRGLESAD